eukprot:s728_g35.t1
MVVEMWRPQAVQPAACSVLWMHRCLRVFCALDASLLEGAGALLQQLPEGWWWWWCWRGSVGWRWGPSQQPACAKDASQSFSKGVAGGEERRSNYFHSVGGGACGVVVVVAVAVVVVVVLLLLLLLAADAWVGILDAYAVSATDYLRIQGFDTYEPLTFNSQEETQLPMVRQQMLLQALDWSP